MKIFRILLISISIITFLIGCKKDGPTKSNGQAKIIHDLLVKEGDISGWTYSGSSCAASNYSELTVCIDGAAPYYQQHGYVESEQQRYQGTVNATNAHLLIAVYNQGTSANAIALYNDTQLGFSGAIDWSATGHAGDAAHYVRNGGLSQQLAFYRSGYYVYVEFSDIDTDESLAVLEQFALNVDGKIKN